MVTYLRDGEVQLWADLHAKICTLTPGPDIDYGDDMRPYGKESSLMSARRLTLRRFICLVLLFCFAFSADAVLYGNHGHSLHDHAPATAVVGDACAHPADHASTDHHDGHSDHSGHHDEGPCCNQHSQASAVFYSLTLTYAPHSSRTTVCEPFRALPEVYLDRFIPPQNLA